MRFAHLKVQHGFERMRLRGLTGARDEFHLAAGFAGKSAELCRCETSLNEKRATI
jgi:hypothetical protein